MPTKWQEKGVGFSLRIGSKPTNKKSVVDERNGTIGGFETEHWDDHQDVEVLAKTVRASLKLNEEE